MCEVDFGKGLRCRRVEREGLQVKGGRDGVECVLLASRSHEA